jgi:hypothetical protein
MVESKGPVMLDAVICELGLHSIGGQCEHSGDPAEEDGAALGRRRLPDYLVPERVVAIGDVVGEVVAALVVAVGVTETIAETSTGCAIVVDGR